MTRENIVGTLTGGDGLTLEEAEDFCRTMHADAAIEYCAGIVRVMAVRARGVS